MYSLSLSFLGRKVGYLGGKLPLPYPTPLDETLYSLSLLLYGLLRLFLHCIDRRPAVTGTALFHAEWRQWLNIAIIVYMHLLSNQLLVAIGAMAFLTKSLSLRRISYCPCFEFGVSYLINAYNVIPKVYMHEVKPSSFFSI